jgi:NADH-quinone oxidoreductase subunit A
LSLSIIVFGVLVAAVLSAAVAGILLALGQWVGPRKPSPVKEEPFETGNPSEGAPRGRIPVHFYRFAILFVLFDVEIAFFYPWAVRYREYGWFGFWEMLVFAGILLLGYVYLWRRGVLEME